MRYYFCFFAVITQLFSGCSNENQESVFGSNLIQSQFWTNEELAGQAGDEHIMRIIKHTFGNPEASLHDNLETNRQWREKVKRYLGGSIRRVNLPEDKKYIALTLDLCESKHEKTGYQRRIFNYLREHGIKATLFAGGKWMHSHPDKTMQLMTDPLFEMANHSWTHVNFRMIDDDKALRQVVWTQHKYKELKNRLYKKVRSMVIEDKSYEYLYKELRSIPEDLYLFRFPFGACSKRNLQLLEKLNVPAIQWDVVSGDPDPGFSAEKIAERILEYSRPGSIIVMHANGRGVHSAEALPLFAPQLLEQGYHFVTVSELLRAAESIEVAESCYAIHPGDAEVYEGIMDRGDLLYLQ